MMVRDFHKVIGEEARRRFWKPRAACRTCWWPAWAAARTPSGSFYAFLRRRRREDAGRGSRRTRPHARRTRRAPRRGRGICGARPGVLQGTYTYVLADGRRADRDHAFGFGGPGLSRGRSGACLAGRAASRRIHGGERRSGAGRRAHAGAPRGHHPGARKRARAGRADRARAADASRRTRDLESLRPRRQGHGNPRRAIS